MGTIMIDKNIDFIKETDTREVFRHIFDKGQGNIIELDSAPTADAPLIETNEIGWYSTGIYWRISKTTILVFDSSSQITVT